MELVGPDAARAYRIVVLDQRGTGQTALDCPPLQRAMGFSDLTPPHRDSGAGLRAAPRARSRALLDRRRRGRPRPAAQRPRGRPDDDLRDVLRHLRRRAVRAAAIRSAPRRSCSTPWSRTPGSTRSPSTCSGLCAGCCRPRVRRSVAPVTRCRTLPASSPMGTTAQPCSTSSRWSASSIRRSSPCWPRCTPRLSGRPATWTRRCAATARASRARPTSSARGCTPVPSARTGPSRGGRQRRRSTDGTRRSRRRWRPCRSPIWCRSTPGPPLATASSGSACPGHRCPTHRWTAAAGFPDVPTLLLAGTHDLSTPLEWAQREAQLAPSGQLVVVEGAGHSVVRQGGRGREALRSFLLR